MLGGSLPLCTSVYPSVNGLSRPALVASAYLPQNHITQCPSACSQVTSPPRPVHHPPWAQALPAGPAPGTQSLPTLTQALSLPPPVTSGNSSPELVPEGSEILLSLASVGPGVGSSPHPDTGVCPIPFHGSQGTFSHNHREEPSMVVPG